MTNKIDERSILIQNNQTIKEIFGEYDENIQIIERELNINIVINSDQIKLLGDTESVIMGEKLIYNLIEIVQKRKKAG